MGVEYFNHFTLNTGHTRKTYPSEINKAFFFDFKPTINKIINANHICDFVIEETYMNITKVSDGFISTLYIKIDGNFAPFLSTIATTSNENIDDYRELVNGLRKYTDGKVAFVLPQPPFIVDVLFPSVVMRPSLLSMTGDLSRCLAWTILSPNSIINQ